MKKIVILLSFVLFLTNCSSDSNQEVKLFNNLKFKLLNNEKINNIDSDKTKLFNSFTDSIPVQIPLFKYISTDNYRIFIGVPVHTSIKELANHNIKAVKNYSGFENDTDYYYLKYQKENNFITIFSKNFDNNLVYVLTISKNPKLSDSLFSKASLSKRFYK